MAFAGCNDRSYMPLRPSLPAPAGPAPPPTPVSPLTPVITLGREVKDTFEGTLLTYQLTAPSNGTLTARLSWNHETTSRRLTLTLGDVSFPAEGPDWSPVVGRLAVSAGQSYRVTIEEGFAFWDYDTVPFVLITAIE
jgi:hypothetical protein